MSNLVPSRFLPRSLRNDMPFFGRDPFRMFFGEDAPTFRSSVRKTEGAYVIEAELPGVARDALKVEAGEGLVTITAEYGSESDAGDYVLSEKRSGTFSRSFAISGVKEEEITAEYRDGVLHVRLPMEEESASRSKRIEIQ